MDTSIVIEREYGSGGREVARILSEKLGIEYYDGNLLVEVSEKFHIDLSVLKDFDEQRIGSMIYNIAMAAKSIQDSSQMEMPYKLYNAQSQLMKQLVAEKPCIFLGRCADEILKDEVRLLKIFIYSDKMEDKIDRVIKVDGVVPEDAETIIHRKDMQRKNYYQYFTDRKWGDMKNYDLCLNTSAIGYEGAAEAIMALL